jgi:guanylate kinase
MNPTIFIISGPGGAGKTTLLNRLFRKKIFPKKFVRGISYTTRKKRPREKNGQDYFFISKEMFLKLKKKKFFLESQKILNSYYGTPRFLYERAEREKKNLILCIDVKGGMYLKKNFRLGKIVSIFIYAPDKNELIKRLKKRVEKQAIIEKRIDLAKRELQFANHYDYVMINEQLATSLKQLERILLA